MTIPVPLYAMAEVIVLPTHCEEIKRNGEPCAYNWKFVRADGAHVCGIHNHDVSVDEIEVTNQVAESNDNNKEEEEMEDNVSHIYHFLVEKVEEGQITLPRILTNIPLESEGVRYTQSLISKRPVDGLLALTTGTWLPWLLQKRLADLGHKFRIMILSNKEMKNLSSDVTRKYHERSTFSWANDSHTFFMRVEGAGWGLGSLGLIERDVPKIAKRFAEICRLSEMMLYSRTRPFNMMALEPPGDIKFYDGMNYMSTEFALKMTRAIPDERRMRRVRYEILNGIRTRLNARILTPEFLLKGDFIIVDGLIADIVYHPENAKRELRTDGWWMATATNHATHHVAVWDSQSWINNRSMLPEGKQMGDVDKSNQDIMDSFRKGEVPEWLMLGEEMHDDSGLPDYERLSDMLDRGYIRWQAHGFDIRAWANAIWMATNGVIKRRERELRKSPVRHYRKTWAMMTNAFLAPVVTRESLHHMAGINMNDQNKYLFHDSKWGLVFSGRRFADTYSLHGGWDEDDTAKLILIKVYSTDKDRVIAMLNSGALDPNCPVPAKEEDAVFAGLVVRSPNGPGEYSIEALDPDNFADMPWHKFDPANVPVVNLVTAPDPQPMLLKNVTVRGIPASLSYTGDVLTKDQCFNMIEAQKFNPGIGMICNCLMNWVMTVGTSFPPDMLALLEQMVDATQQLRDPVSFQAIAEEVNNLYQQMVDKVVADNLKVDGLLAIAHPIPRKFATPMRGNMVAGRFTRFNNYYGAKIEELRQEVRNNSLQMRHTLELTNYIRKFIISPETTKWAKKFYERYNAHLENNGKIWSTNEMEERNPFAKMHFEIQRTAANRATIADAVAELRAFGGENTHRRVIALWHYVVTPTQRYPMGLSDRLMFQPGQDESIMDLCIEALRWRGRGNDFTVKEG